MRLTVRRPASPIDLGHDPSLLDPLPVSLTSTFRAPDRFTTGCFFVLQSRGDTHSLTGALISSPLPFAVHSHMSFQFLYPLFGALSPLFVGRRRQVFFDSLALFSLVVLFNGFLLDPFCRLPGQILVSLLPFPGTQAFPFPEILDPADCLFF